MTISNFSDHAPSHPTRLIHFIWLGDAQIPKAHREFMATWAVHHPAWRVLLWTDDNAGEFPIFDKLKDKCLSPSAQSDILRYCILVTYGGLYVDTDFECLKPLDALIGDGQKLIIGRLPLNMRTAPDAVGTGLVYAPPGHPACVETGNRLRNGRFGPISGHLIGPHFFRNAIRSVDPETVVSHAAAVFYPYAPGETFDHALADHRTHAVHHWEGSWLTDDQRAACGRTDGRHVNAPTNEPANF